jgi:hypothetical protein
VRTGRRVLAGRLEGLAHLLELLVGEGLPDLGEELVLLLLDVVADALGQHPHLGVEALVGGGHLLELGERPLHHVVLLEGFEHAVGRVGDRRPDPRVEHLLLDGGVGRQLLNELVDDVALLGRIVVVQVLVALEERLDVAVVVLEDGKRVHALVLPGSADV